MKKIYIARFALLGLTLFVFCLCIFNIPSSIAYASSIDEASQGPSTIEIQRDIQKKWAEVENLRSKYTSLWAESGEVIARLDEQIEDAKTTLHTAQEGSAQQLEAQTRLTELLAEKHIKVFVWCEKCKGIGTEIVHRIVDI